jgi:hypothetical protein
LAQTEKYDGRKGGEVVGKWIREGIPWNEARKLWGGYEEWWGREKRASKVKAGKESGESRRERTLQKQRKIKKR